MKLSIQTTITLILAMLLLYVTSNHVALAFPGIQITGSPTFDRIKARGYLVVGVKYDSPPFGYIDSDGKLKGFEIDLMHEFARRWLGDDQAVEFVQVISSNRIERLLKGDIDLVAATMTYTPERDEQIDFSQTYYQDGQNILVLQDSNLRKGTDDERIRALQGKRIAVVKDSTSIRGLAELTRTYLITVEIAEFEQYDQVIQPLLEKRVDALTTDRGILEGLHQQHAELEILLNENISQKEFYGLGLPPGDVAFANLVNETLQSMQQDNTYTTIYQRWFPEQFPLTPEVTGTISPTAAPTATAIPPTLTMTPSPTSTTLLTTTVTMITTSTPQPAPSPTSASLPGTDIGAPPTMIPTAGSSLYSYRFLPMIVLLSTLLFVASIYAKRRRT